MMKKFSGMLALLLLCTIFAYGETREERTRRIAVSRCRASFKQIGNSRISPTEEMAKKIVDKWLGWHYSLKFGSKVTLGEFSGRYWKSPMSRYVNRNATAETFYYDPVTFESYVRVRWAPFYWRMSSLKKGHVRHSYGQNADTSASVKEAQMLYDNFKKRYKVEKTKAMYLLLAFDEMSDPDWRKGLKENQLVILGPHSSLAGSRQWTGYMERYVNRIARIRSFEYKENRPYPSARYEPCVKVTGNPYSWRVRNLRKYSGKYGLTPNLYNNSTLGWQLIRSNYKTSSNSAQWVARRINNMPDAEWKRNLRKGSSVKLGRHTSLYGQTNWRKDLMERYVGQTRKIKGFKLISGSDEPYVYFDFTPGLWRVRNLGKPPVNLLEGWPFIMKTYKVRDSGGRIYPMNAKQAQKVARYINMMPNRSFLRNMKPGYFVILGRNNTTEGKRHWKPGMEKLVGKTARIKELFVYEGTAEPLAIIQNSREIWGVRGMRNPLKRR